MASTKNSITSPLTDAPGIIASVAFFAGKDVRRALELLFVCNSWQRALNLESCPQLWKLHATECQDPEGKLLLKAAAHKLPHLVDILMMKFKEVKENEDSKALDDASVHPLAPIKDIDGRTPLHFIAQSPSVFSIETARQFIKLGVDVAAKDQIISVGETACHVAAASGNVDMIALLLENDKTLVSALDESKWTPLFSAVHHGEIKASKLLMAQHEGSESDSEFILRHRDINGCNVFHHAAQSGSAEMINFLSNVSVNPTARMNSLNTTTNSSDAGGAVDNASGDRAKYVSKLLVEPAEMTGKNSFMHAVESGNLETVKAIARRAGPLMVEAINAADVDGETALMMAARQGFTEIIDFLLKTYPTMDQDLRNKEKQSALDIAAAYRKKEVINMLCSSRKTGGCCC